MVSFYWTPNIDNAIMANTAKPLQLHSTRSAQQFYNKNRARKFTNALFQCHPDLYPDNPTKAEEYLQLQASYNILMSSESDPSEPSTPEPNENRTDFAQEIDKEFLKRYLFANPFEENLLRLCDAGYLLSFRAWNQKIARIHRTCVQCYDLYLINLKNVHSIPQNFPG